MRNAIYYLAKGMKKALDHYKNYTREDMNMGNFKGVCHRATILLFQLGEKQDFSEEELEVNGHPMTRFLDALERLDLEGRRNQINVNEVTKAYQSSRKYLPKIRRELVDYLNGSKR